MCVIYSEILRVIDSVQLTESHKVATPVDWKVILFAFSHTEHFSHAYNLKLSIFSYS